MKRSTVEHLIFTR